MSDILSLVGSQRKCEIAAMDAPNIELDRMTGETAGELAYRQIRRDIVFGTLGPGTRLRLESLKTPYLASVSTLREVFNRLASERFVVAEDQRGFRVTPVSQNHFREIAGMRELLECHALRRAFERGDLEWESQVVAAHYKLAKMEALLANGEVGHTETWKRYDREFHSALIAPCGSKTLMETYRRIFDHYLRYQIIAVIYRGDAAATEHRLLLECALRRDAASACEILSRHIRACVEHTLDAGLIGQ